MAQGDEQVATLVHVGGIELECWTEGIGGLASRVGVRVDAERAAAHGHGIGPHVAGKVGAEFPWRSGGGTEHDAVVTPLAWFRWPGGLAAPESECQSLDFGAGWQVAEQFSGIDELHRPGITAQGHVQAIIPGMAGGQDEVGGQPLAGDGQTVGAGEAAGGSDLEVDQVEAVGEWDGVAGAIGADGQQGDSVQAEVEQGTRILGGGGQAQTGHVGRHGEGIAFRFGGKDRIEVAGVGTERDQTGVGGQAVDLAEA